MSQDSSLAVLTDCTDLNFTHVSLTGAYQPSAVFSIENETFLTNNTDMSPSQVIDNKSFLEKVKSLDVADPGSPQKLVQCKLIKQSLRKKLFSKKCHKKVSIQFECDSTQSFDLTVDDNLVQNNKSFKNVNDKNNVTNVANSSMELDLENNLACIRNFEVAQNENLTTISNLSMELESNIENISSGNNNESECEGGLIQKRIQKNIPCKKISVCFGSDSSMDLVNTDVSLLKTSITEPNSPMLGNVLKSSEIGSNHQGITSDTDVIDKDSGKEALIEENIDHSIIPSPENAFCKEGKIKHLMSRRVSVPIAFDAYSLYENGSIENENNKMSNILGTSNESCAEMNVENKQIVCNSSEIENINQLENSLHQFSHNSDDLDNRPKTRKIKTKTLSRVSVYFDDESSSMEVSSTGKEYKECRLDHVSENTNISENNENDDVTVNNKNINLFTNHKHKTIEYSSIGSKDVDTNCVKNKKDYVIPVNTILTEMEDITGEASELVNESELIKNSSNEDSLRSKSEDGGIENQIQLILVSQAISIQGENSESLSSSNKISESHQAELENEINGSFNTNYLKDETINKTLENSVLNLPEGSKSKKIKIQKVVPSKKISVCFGSDSPKDLVARNESSFRRNIIEAKNSRQTNLLLSSELDPDHEGFSCNTNANIDLLDLESREKVTIEESTNLHVTKNNDYMVCKEKKLKNTGARKVSVPIAFNTLNITENDSVQNKDYKMHSSFGTCNESSFEIHETELDNKQDICNLGNIKSNNEGNNSLNQSTDNLSNIIHDIGSKRIKTKPHSRVSVHFSPDSTIQSNCNKEYNDPDNTSDSVMRNELNEGATDNNSLRPECEDGTVQDKILCILASQATTIHGENSESLSSCSDKKLESHQAELENEINESSNTNYLKDETISKPLENSVLNIPEGSKSKKIKIQKVVPSKKISVCFGLDSPKDLVDRNESSFRRNIIEAKNSRQTNLLLTSELDPEHEGFSCNTNASIDLLDVESREKVTIEESTNLHVTKNNDCTVGKEKKLKNMGARNISVPIAFNTLNITENDSVQNKDYKMHSSFGTCNESSPEIYETDLECKQDICNVANIKNQYQGSNSLNNSTANLSNIIHDIDSKKIKTKQHSRVSVHFSPDSTIESNSNAKEECNFDLVSRKSDVQSKNNDNILIDVNGRSKGVMSFEIGEATGYSVIASRDDATDIENNKRDVSIFPVNGMSMVTGQNISEKASDFVMRNESSNNSLQSECDDGAVQEKIRCVLASLATSIQSENSESLSSCPDKISESHQAELKNEINGSFNTNYLKDETISKPLENSVLNLPEGSKSKKIKIQKVVPSKKNSVCFGSDLHKDLVDRNESSFRRNIIEAKNSRQTNLLLTSELDPEHEGFSCNTNANIDLLDVESREKVTIEESTNLHFTKNNDYTVCKEKKLKNIGARKVSVPIAFNTLNITENDSVQNKDYKMHRSFGTCNESSPEIHETELDNKQDICNLGNIKSNNEGNNSLNQSTDNSSKFHISPDLTIKSNCCNPEHIQDETSDFVMKNKLNEDATGNNSLRPECEDGTVQDKILSGLASQATSIHGKNSESLSSCSDKILESHQTELENEINDLSSTNFLKGDAIIDKFSKNNILNLQQSSKCQHTKTQKVVSSDLLSDKEPTVQVLIEHYSNQCVMEMPNDDVCNEQKFKNASVRSVSVPIPFDSFKLKENMSKENENDTFSTANGSNIEINEIKAENMQDSSSDIISDNHCNNPVNSFCDVNSEINSIKSLKTKRSHASRLSVHFNLESTLNSIGDVKESQVIDYSRDHLSKNSNELVSKIQSLGDESINVPDVKKLKISPQNGLCVGNIESDQVEDIDISINKNISSDSMCNKVRDVENRVDGDCLKTRKIRKNQSNISVKNFPNEKKRVNKVNRNTFNNKSLKIGREEDGLLENKILHSQLTSISVERPQSLNNESYIQEEVDIVLGKTGHKFINANSLKEDTIKDKSLIGSYLIVSGGNEYQKTNNKIANAVEENSNKRKKPRDLQMSVGLSIIHKDNEELPGSSNIKRICHSTPMVEYQKFRGNGHEKNSTGEEITSQNHVFVCPDIPSRNLTERSVKNKSLLRSKRYRKDAENNSESLTKKSKTFYHSADVTDDFIHDISIIPNTKAGVQKKMFHSTPINKTNGKKNKNVLKISRNNVKINEEEHIEHDDKMIQVSKTIFGSSTEVTNGTVSKKKLEETSASTEQSCGNKSKSKRKRSHVYSDVQRLKELESSGDSRSYHSDFLSTLENENSYYTRSSKKRVAFKDISALQNSTNDHGNSISDSSYQKSVKFRDVISVIDDDTSVSDLLDIESNNNLTVVDSHSVGIDVSNVVSNLEESKSRMDRSEIPINYVTELTPEIILTENEIEGNSAMSAECSLFTKMKVISKCQKGNNKTERRKTAIQNAELIRVKGGNFENDFKFVSSDDESLEKKLMPREKWVSPNLIKYLSEKLMNDDLDYVVSSERIISILCSAVNAVKNLRNVNDIELALLPLKNVLVKYKICNNMIEYSTFISRFTSFEFQCKALPMGGYYGSVKRTSHKILTDTILMETEIISNFINYSH